MSTTLAPPTSTSKSLIDQKVTPKHSPKKRRELVPSSVLGTLLFVISETMFFAGAMSAFTISRANAPAGMWPPPGQPMLPASQTAVNTVILMASGVLMAVTHYFYVRNRGAAKITLASAWVLAAGFVALQGREWAALLSQGLTLKSSSLGSFFYLIVGGHALHAIIALGVVAIAWFKLSRETLSRSYFFAAQTFWYFVVGMWPAIYFRLYF